MRLLSHTHTQQCAREIRFDSRRPDLLSTSRALSEQALDPAFAHVCHFETPWEIAKIEIVKVPDIHSAYAYMSIHAGTYIC